MMHELNNVRLKQDEHAGHMIWGENGELRANVRGWGYLTGHGNGGLGIEENEAMAIQDEFGRRLVAAWNATLDVPIEELEEGGVCAMIGNNAPLALDVA